MLASMEEEKEEDRVLAQMKRTQAHVSIWELLMVSQNYQALVLEALSGNEVPIETTPQKVLAIMGVKAISHPSLTFSNEELPFEGITHTRSF